jgi:hypothetical protein
MGSPWIIVCSVPSGQVCASVPINADCRATCQGLTHARFPFDTGGKRECNHTKTVLKLSFFQSFGACGSVGTRKCEGTGKSRLEKTFSTFKDFPFAVLTESPVVMFLLKDQYFFASPIISRLFSSIIFTI